MKILICLLLATLLSRAEDWSVAGKDYHNVIVGQIEADKVHITYDGGIGTIALADLSPDLQKRFGYDSVAAKAAQKAAEERQAKIDNDPAVIAQRIAVLKYVEVNQVTPDGLIVSPLVGVMRYGAVTADYQPSDQLVFIHSKFDNIVDGQRLLVKVYRSGTYSYQTVLGATKTVEEWVAVGPPPKEAYQASN